MTFAEKLKAWHGGKTRGAQRAFAKHFRVSEGYASALVQGRQPPGEELAARVAKEFGTTTAELLALFEAPGPAGLEERLARVEAELKRVYARLDAIENRYEAPGASAWSGAALRDSESGEAIRKEGREEPARAPRSKRARQRAR
jgi:transcriptional regulator with XRE-family HTH domain